MIPPVLRLFFLVSSLHFSIPHTQAAPLSSASSPLAVGAPAGLPLPLALLPWPRPLLCCGWLRIFQRRATRGRGASAFTTSSYPRQAFAFGLDRSCGGCHARTLGLAFGCRSLASALSHLRDPPAFAGSALRGLVVLAGTYAFQPPSPLLVSFHPAWLSLLVAVVISFG